MDEWVDIEFFGLKLGDKRVDEHALKIIKNLASKIGAPITQVFNSWSESKSCYEFFHNGKVKPEKILSPHKKATIERIKKEPIVLLPQDTSSFNYTNKPSMSDLGNIGSTSSQGIFLHPLLAITPNRVNLGIVEAKIWTRDLEKKKRTDHEAYSLPIEEKEKYRWIESYHIACDLAKKCPNTQIIVLSDREADFAEYFEHTQTAQKNENFAHIIVRSYHDRVLQPSADYSSNSEEGLVNKKLRDKLISSTPLGQVTFTIPATANRKARKVTQTLKATPVTFKKRSTGKNSDYPLVTINSVMAIEENPPEGEEPITWILLTTLPIENFEQVAKVIQYYLSRWEIEIFFKVLKSGCHVEEKRLTGGAMMPLIAIFLVIAWRIMYTMMMSRSAPDISCEAIFSEAEWKSVHKILYRGTKLPDKPPSLGEFIKMIAKLGGYLDRKNDPPPGPKMMWIGFNRMYDFSMAWEAFNSS